ncbi:MAG TPA: hypothetical protein VHD56_08050 [Tepidisphaeraceae bacterium]|nr:hypothetical protein [Tepidisphaeraceae bacterium]
MTIQRTLLGCLFALIVFFQLGASCSTQETVVYRDRGPVYVQQPPPVYVQPPPPPPVYEQQPPVIIEEPPPVVIRPGNPWPHSAVLVDEGQGGRSWTADRDGIVYFVDAGQNRCVASVEVRRGETVRIEPRQDRILVNGRVVFHENLRGEARFQILFSAYRNGPGRGPGPGRGGNGNPGPIPPPPPPDRPGPPPVAGGNTWPRDAAIVAQGQDRLTWQAVADGSVWIVDAGVNREVYRMDVRRNQMIVVEPRQDRILLDNRAVFTQNMRGEARHQILFVPRGGGARGGGPDPRPPAGGGPAWPRDAVVVAQGQDRLTWQPTSNGTVYIIDAGQNTKVFQADVRRNQLIVVEPRQDKILIDNKVVFNQNMRGEARHQILFTPSR